MLSILYLLAAISAQSPQETPPREIAGKDLPYVPGPYADRYRRQPGWADPAAGPGNSPIQMRIRESSRRSPSIPAVALPEGDGAVAVGDCVGSMAGWKAYRVEVPAGAKVHARIRGDHPAWFLVRTVNRTGGLEEGMLQNLIPTGNPEASYTNPKAGPSTVYFVVDTKDPDISTEKYTLVVDWPKPAK